MRIKKELIPLSLVVLLLVSVAMAGNEPRYQNQQQNDTYVDLDTGIELSAQGWALNWTKVSTIDATGVSGLPYGVTTNSTDHTTLEYVYIMDYDDDNIEVFDGDGNSIQNISLTITNLSPHGITVNASGTAVTDFWVLDAYNKVLWHLEEDGSKSVDPVGNFSIAGETVYSRGVTTNATNRAPTDFWIVDIGLDKIIHYTADGTNVDNITLPAAIGDATGIWTNDTNTVAKNFFLVDRIDDKVYHIDDTGTIIDSFDISAAGAGDGAGITGTDVATEVENILVVDYTDDDVYSFFWRRLDYAVLSTNETGTWENKTNVYSSPMDMGNAVATKWSNFTWQNTTLDCNKVIGWKIYYNDTYGDENVTGTKIFYHIPYINETSYALSKITATTCEDKNNITMTFDTTPAGYVGVIMPLVYWDTTGECSYQSTEGTRLELYNYSDYCWAKLNHSSLASGDTIKIYKSPTLRVEPPPNLPALLGAALIGTIIVIYLITTREEE